MVGIEAHERSLMMKMNNYSVEFMYKNNRRIVGCVNARWLNRLNQRLYFSCPRGQSIYQIRSKHSNRAEDRYWDLRCRNSDANGNCYWTRFLNRFDAIVSFNCKSNEVISGMFSIHNNRREDRMFKVKCCKVTVRGYCFLFEIHLDALKKHKYKTQHVDLLRLGRSLRKCYQTPYINDYDGYFNYIISKLYDY
ncbi:hypothetical protein KUTeg_013134 [Tegillarca granosa]|uniref:Uncharacterized protein n=1 Tax=Tegillarca granosa TaxID=220873 RepID=A0ABQ9EWV8_TEGGR|nr:hypothetical protein KUTeg_013134 [Tegillarca granosa]